MVLDIGIAFGELLQKVTSSKAVMISLFAIASSPIANMFIGIGSKAIGKWEELGIALTQASKASKTFDASMVNVKKTSKKAQKAYDALAESMAGVLSGIQDAENQDIFIKKLNKMDGAAWESLLGNKQLDENTKAKLENFRATSMLDTSSVKLKKSMGGFTKVIKGLWTSVAPMMLVAGIVGAIALAVYAMDKLIITTKENSEALSNLKTKYDETKSSLAALNSELETTKSRIDELSGKAGITVVEQEELEKLKLQNQLLENQIALEEANAKSAKKSLMSQSKKTLTDNTESSLFANGGSNFGEHGTGEESYSKITPIEKLNQYSSKYQQLTDVILEAQDKYNRTFDENQREKIAKEIEGYQEEQNKTLENATILQSTISEAMQSLSESTDINDKVLFDSLQKQIQSSMAGLGIEYKITPTLDFLDVSNEELKGLQAQLKDLDVSIPIEYEDGMGLSDIKDVTDGIISLNNEFKAGTIDIVKYCDTLQSQIDNIDFRKLSENGTKTGMALQSIFSNLVTTVQSLYDNIEKSFDNSLISGSEYSNGISETTENLNEFIDELKTVEDIDAFGISSEKLKQLQSDLKNSNEELENFDEFLKYVNENSDFIAENLNEIGEVSFDNFDEGTKGFGKFKSALVDELNYLKKYGNDSFKAIVTKSQAMGIELLDSHGNINEAALDDAETTSKVGNILVEEVGTKMKNVTTAIGVVLEELGKLIEQFELTINITPTIDFEEISSTWYDKFSGKKEKISFPVPKGSIKITGKQTGTFDTSKLESAGGLVMSELLKPSSTGTGGVTGGLDTQGKESDSGSDDILKAYDSYKAYLEHLIKLSQEFQKTLAPDSDEYKAEFDKQIGYYKELQNLAHKYAEELRAKGYTQQNKEIQELQSDWWDFYNNIQELKFAKIDDSYQYEKSKISQLSEMLKSKKDAMILGTDEWSEANTKLLEYHNELAEQTLDYIKELKALDPLKYSEQINEAEKEYLSILKEQLEIKESIADAYESIPGIVDKIITKEKIEPLKKQKDVLEGIKELNKEIIGLEKDKAQAIMGGEDELASQFQSQIDYINQQKIELSNITDLDEKKNKLAQINLTLGKMKIDQLKAELALIQGQRNQRVYHDDAGWQWESDKEAELNKQQQIMEAEADAEIDAIDSQIDSWEDYIDKFGQAVDDYKLGQETMTLSGLLGANARNKLLNGEISILDKFISKYAKAQQAVIAMQEAIVNMEEAFEVPTINSGGVNSYNIGTQAGATIANNLKSGETFKADDGSTWLKNADGSLSVTTKSGNTYAGNITYSGNSSFSSSGSSSNTSPKTSGNYTIGSTAGKQIASSLASGQSYSASDGSTWTKNKDGSITVTTKAGSTLAGVATKHDGIESGLIGGLPLNPETEQLVKAAKGEGIFTESQMNNISSELMALRLLALPQISSKNNGMSDNSTSISINNMNVTCEDANDFLKQMKNLVIVTGKN